MKGLKDTGGSHGGGATRNFITVLDGHTRGVIAEFFDLGEFFLVAVPVLEAADAPVGEVLGGDRFAGELTGENFLYGSKVVEPRENDGGRLAIEEALVELIADVVGETGDFAAPGGQPWCVAEIFFRHAGSLRRAGGKEIVRHYL